MAWGRYYRSPRTTIIRSVHLCCCGPQICWCRFLQSNETACACIEARSQSIFRPRPVVYPNLVRLSKRSEYCSSSGIHRWNWYWEVIICSIQVVRALSEQLALVLKPDPTAFSDLDQLYSQILSVYPSTVNIVQVLGFIIASFQNSPEVIGDILGMEEGKLKLVLRGLSSLMKDESDKDRRVTSYVTPHFAHSSFSDYLFNSSRSGPFHVNRQEYGNQVTLRIFALILQSIRRSLR